MATELYAPDSLEAKALLAVIAKRTVELGPKSGRWRLDEISLGSGAIVKAGGRTFVATAKHNFEERDPADFVVNFFDNYVPASAEDARRNISRGTGKAGAQVPVKHAVLAQDPKLDLAVIELTDLPDWCEACDLDAGQLHEAAPGDSLFAHGLPAAAGLNERRGDHYFHAGLSLPFSGDYLEVEDTTEWTHGFDRRIHFAMKYDRTIDPSRAVHPAGMSGCGIWKLGSKSKRMGLFHPQGKLAGIQVSYLKHRDALKVVRVGALFEFLRREVLTSDRPT